MCQTFGSISIKNLNRKFHSFYSQICELKIHKKLFMGFFHTTFYLQIVAMHQRAVHSFTFNSLDNGFFGLDI